MKPLNEVSHYRVLVIGDAIYDHYRFCDTLGRGTKDSIMSVKFLNEETYQGGVWASAAHLADLVDRVDIWHGSDAAVNIKYLGPYKQKLFSVHESKMVDGSVTPPDLTIYDLVIVFDYGMGFLTRDLRERIMNESEWLAVNAQSNSTNYGFNRVNEKWPRADFCVVDELEARLAAHEQDAPLEEVIAKLPYPRTIVTRGAHGSVGYHEGVFVKEEALTDRPIDLLGAGDAVLAVVAPFARAGWAMADLVHLGNVAGMIKVSILGHQTRITKAELEKHLCA